MRISDWSSDVCSSDLSRRKHIAEEARTKFHRQIARVRPGSHAFEIAKRVAVGTYNDGFIHAGNLAYLSLMTLFPFFIVAAAVASIFGWSQDGLAAVGAFLETVRPGGAGVGLPPRVDVLNPRTEPR